jgi:hypothetical protein
MNKEIHVQLNEQEKLIENFLLSFKPQREFSSSRCHECRRTQRLPRMLWRNYLHYLTIRKSFSLFKREKKVFLRDLIHFSNSRWSAKRNAKKLRKFAQHKE